VQQCSPGAGSLVASNGYTVLHCYDADLNPTNATSRLAITGLGVVSGNAHLTWIGGNNAWQYVECTPSLASDQWTTIFTNTPPTAITNTVILGGADGFTNLFYRIKANR